MVSTTSFQEFMYDMNFNGPYIFREKQMLFSVIDFAFQC